MIKIFLESDKFSHKAGVTKHATNTLARKSHVVVPYRVVAPTSQLSKRPVCADILEIHISKQTITTYNKNYFSDHFITIYHV